MKAYLCRIPESHLFHLIDFYRINNRHAITANLLLAKWLITVYKGR